MIVMLILYLAMEVEQDYIKTINCDKCVFKTLENCAKRTENCEYFIQKYYER